MDPKPFTYEHFIQAARQDMLGLSCMHWAPFYTGLFIVK